MVASTAGVYFASGPLMAAAGGKAWVDPVTVRVAFFAMVSIGLATFFRGFVALYVGTGKLRMQGSLVAIALLTVILLVNYFFVGSPVMPLAFWIVIVTPFATSLFEDWATMKQKRLDSAR